MAKRRKKTNSKVPAKGRLRDMADQLWSLAVKEDWGWSCAVCVCDATKLESHHLIPRQHYATRYLLENGISLCSTHHQFCATLSPHQNAAGFLLWLELHWPERHKWLIETVQDGAYRQFNRTKNADYFCDVIGDLREYVEEADYRSILGQRFSEWLDERE